MADASIAPKTCVSCGLSKTLDDFHRNNATKDGRIGKCKTCVKIYQQENKKRIAAYQREWAKNNPDKNRAKSNRWRANHPEEAKVKDRANRTKNSERRAQQAAEWRAKNRERVLEYQKQYELRRRDERAKEKRIAYAQNPEAARAASAAWRAANPEARRAQKHARRARKKNAPGSYTVADIRRLFDLQRGRCTVCRLPMKEYHVDHKVALARGGSNDWTNLQLLHPRCNLNKHDKDEIEFMQEQGFLL